MKTAIKFVAILMILGLALGLTTIHPVYAASTLYVATTGNDSNDCLSAETACLTIEGAVAKAVAGDTISVAAGEYSPTGTILIDKSLSISGPTTGEAKVIGLGGSTVRVFSITASDVSIQHLTITLGTAPVNTNYDALVDIPDRTTPISNIDISNNKLFVAPQSGAMSTWGARGVMSGHFLTNSTISNNEIYNTRSGIVIGYTSGLVTITDNVIYNTKGGIMNYTGSAADAANRVMTGNSWNDIHNEWDIVWNSGGGPYVMDMDVFVLQKSQANNDAYVVSQMTTGTLAALTSNRSHVFISPTGTTTLKADNGNINVPYAKIQDGINAVVPGGTVIVEPGTYSEKNISINKSLTLLGDPGDSTPGSGVNAPVVDGGSAYGDAFKIANGVSNVTIKGFEVRNYATISGDFDGVGNAVSAWVGHTSNITVQDNYFHHLGYNGVLVGNDKNSDPNKWGDHTNWSIKNNIIENFGYIGFELTNTSNSTIEGNIIHMSTPYIGAVFASARRSESGLTVKNNTIDGTPSSAYPVIYMYAYDLDMANPNLDNVVIQGNIINTIGTPFQVYIRNIGTGTITNVKVELNQLSTVKNTTTGTLDSSPNWWGQATGPTTSQMSGSMTYIPWCTNAVCTEFGGPVTNVTRHLGYATIQAAINDANSSEVLSVAAGTFVENVVVDVPVEIYGAGQGNTIVMPAVSAANPCTGSSLCGGTASNVFLVQANNVKIHDLTIDGDNPGLTSGIVRGGADLDARNGIIKNTDVDYNNLEVYNTTVQNIYLRGIYSTGGSFNFHHNTVTNVQGDGYSIGMFAWGGPGTFANNTVSYANDGISANHSKGIQFLNNTVTHSGSGIHTDNSNDAGGVADLIQGNSVDCYSLPNAYGIWTFVPYKAPTINNNTIANCSVGLSDWGQGAVVIPQFTNNIVTGDSTTGSVGAYITTDLIGYGYTDVSVYFEGNTISGFEYGVQLAGNQQNWNTYPFVASTINATFFKNKITNYTNSVSKDTGGLAYNANFASNYWGSACGPSNISSGITYSPWYTDEAMTSLMSGAVGSYTIAPGTSTDAINATIACAAPGSTFTFQSGNHNGNIVIPAGRNNLTFTLQTGAKINANSPCFTVNADYITIQAVDYLGATCTPSDGSNGIEVVGARKNLTLSRFIIDGTNGANGIHFGGVMTDLVIADLLIHKNPANGILFDAQPAGVLDIHGNMFRDNTLKGIEAGSNAVPAKYNSWGSYDGPVAGDGISSGVDADPWTHVDISLSSSTPIANTVVTGKTITYSVLANLQNVTAVDFTLYYPANLTYVSSSKGANFDSETLDQTAGQLYFQAYKFGIPVSGQKTLFTATFSAGTPGVGEMNLDDTTDGFGMATTGSSSNIYAYALTDATVTVLNALDMTALSLIESVNKSDWTNVYGTLPASYVMGLDPVNEFEYLDTSSITANHPLANGLQPLYLSTSGLSPEFYAYWAAQGVTASATPGTGEAVMWQIISGAQPIAYLKVNGTSYDLIDGWQYLVGMGEQPMRISGNYPLGTYHFTGTVTDIYGGTDDIAPSLTYVAPVELQSLILKDSISLPGTWNNVFGSLSAGFTKVINPLNTYEYLDAANVVADRTLADGLYPYYLNTTSLPAGFATYWAGKGVVSGATGWQGVMWEIINGNQPMFYLKVSGDDTVFDLIDGLQYQLGGGEQTLRLNGDYPLGTYYFTGIVQDTYGVFGNATVSLTLIPPLDLSAADLLESVDQTTWTTVYGTLPVGYVMAVDPANPFEYLDTTNVVVNRALAIGRYPLYLDITSVPAGYYAYWAAQNVTAAADPSTWQGVMWQIITGAQPIAYFKVSTGPEYDFIDGLQYLTGGGEHPLRLSGDSPLGTYTFIGSVADEFGYTDTLEMNLSLLGTWVVKGTFSMQGRVVRSGLPVTLTGLVAPIFGPYSGSTFNIISENLTLTGVQGGTYRITTLQPRYLNVTSDLGKTVAISTARTIAGLELKGGNAKWEDNIINIQDAGVIGGQWNSSTPGDGDVNFDGKVNIQDLALVGGNYGATSASAYGTWVP